MKNFMDAVESVVNTSHLQHTTNGAVGYSTTEKPLLDLNFAVASLRKASDNEIIERFNRAAVRDTALSVVWLFYARDAREGLGERRLFRVIMRHIAKTHPTIAEAVVKLIPEYGRWDDMIDLVTLSKFTNTITSIIKEQLKSDIANMKAGKSISLLAKWMPSINTSSAETVHKANIIRNALGLTHRQYRKTLSALRNYLNVIECKMSAKEWSTIDYEAVPSRANLIYNDAFLRNDEDRRRAYLGALTKGEAKINASVVFPHDIVHKCYGGRKDPALEAMWKSLPDLVQGDDSTLVVADGSGSMTTIVDRNSSVTALEVANALAIYFAERAKGQFKNKYITFSSQPQLVTLNANSLAGNLAIAKQHNEVSNTNIEATFDLILQTAVKYRMKQSDMPKNILIISDMEFDSATSGNNWCGYRNFASPSKTLFNTIAAKFHRAGYKMPRLVFWNVNSSTGTIPVKENELGVALVSGFSPNVVKMVMSNKLDPWAALVDILNDKRYDAVRAALAPWGGKQAPVRVRTKADMFDEVKF